MLVYNIEYRVQFIKQRDNEIQNYNVKRIKNYEFIDINFS